MKKFEILFGGLCGFYFDDHGDKKGRLHAILVDSQKAIGGMDHRHAPLLVFNFDEVDLDNSDHDFDVVIAPDGSNLGIWDLTQKICYLCSDGSEISGVWPDQVLPHDLFQMKDIAEPSGGKFGELDSQCLEFDIRPKPVASRIELAGGSEAALKTATTIDEEWTYNPGGKPSRTFARTLAYSVEADGPFSIRIHRFRVSNDWTLQFKQETDKGEDIHPKVTVTNYPVHEKHEHFMAYFDLNPRPTLPIKKRGYPEPMIEGVRTGCIPGGFSG